MRLAQAAIVADPARTGSYVALGDIYAAAGQPDYARSYYDAALDIDPADAAAQKALSRRCNRDHPETTARSSTMSVLVLDFGSQVTQLIARRVREAGVYCEIVPFNKAEEALAKKPHAIILSGGPRSVYEENAPRAPQARVRGGRAGAGHLLWRDDHVARSWAARSKAAITRNSAAPTFM